MPTPDARIDAFALTVPGLGPMLRHHALSVGLRAGAVEHDGRADVVPIRGSAAAIAGVRILEDVCLDLGTIAVGGTAAATAAALDVRRLRQGLAALRRLHGDHLARGVRVVVRLRWETGFRRTALRTALVHQLGRLHDGSPAAAELWVIQTTRSALRVGLRISGWSRRGDRVVELAGALRPAVAAAMVALAGPPGALLDPCCGTGTILAEAGEVGWIVTGCDIDGRALGAARANADAGCAARPSRDAGWTAPAARAHAGGGLARLDARQLPFRSGAFTAVVTNLPFGHQHQVQGMPVSWYRRVLSEAMRVAPTAVVLAPPTTSFRQALGRLKIELADRHDIVVLGRGATIWVLRRPDPDGRTRA